MSPMAVVECQMAALQRNDWPDTDAGVQTAFAFSKPYAVDHPLAHGERRCRTWFAEDKWLTVDEFSKMMHTQPYACFTYFDEWKVRIS